MIYIGVDPGKHGAFAAIITAKYKPEIEVYPWDDVNFAHRMSCYRKDSSGCMACVEKVGAMPGQGVSSMFSFGKSAGFIEGVFTALGIPYQLVPPQRWKKEFSLGSDKAQSVETCKKLFPNVKLIPEGKRKEQDGLAEALLMAEYAKRHF